MPCQLLARRRGTGNTSAIFRAKDGNSYFPAHDECGAQWIDRDTLFCILDDIVVYARSLAEHDATLREVFDRIRENRLELKPKNANFLGRKLAT